MLTLNDGRNELWQWDTNRKLTVDTECSQVHFSNKVFGRSVDVDVVDGIAVIPDILLQADKELTAWAFAGTPENGYTKISKTFNVNRRNKPADYVFTAPDQTTLGDILDRIEDLENRPSGDVSKEDIQNAVNDYLDKNPVSFEEKDPTVPTWAKQPEKPQYTAAEVGALPVDTVIPEGGIPIPPTASVGQTIVVKEVDENGKPTEWEVADMTSSGGGGIVEVYKTTTTEDVSRITITKDSDGNAFSYKMMWVYVYIPKVATEVSGAIAMLSIGANENRNVAIVNITSSYQLYINATAYPTGLAESFTNGDYVSANIKREYHENSSPYSKVVLRANTYAVADARIPAGTIVKVFGMN